MPSPEPPGGGKKAFRAGEETPGRFTRGLAQEGEGVRGLLERNEPDALHFRGGKIGPEADRISRCGQSEGHTGLNVEQLLR